MLFFSDGGREPVAAGQMHWTLHKQQLKHD